MGFGSTAQAYMEGIGTSVVVCATMDSLPLGAELLIASFSKQVEADACEESVMFVVPGSCSCAFQDIMLVPDEADSTDG